MILSEGATWAGHPVEEYGPADAYGHKKKVNIAEIFSGELRGRTGEETVVYDLTYQLRSGDPDFLDKMIASTFATMAFECIDSGGAGRMMAIQNGVYTDTPIPDPGLGARTVDVETMYKCRALSPELLQQTRVAYFPDTGVTRLVPAPIAPPSGQSAYATRARSH